MKSTLVALAATGLLVASVSPSQAGNGAGEFEEASLSVVFNATDSDAQIFIVAESNEGLQRVRVFSPDGSLVAKSKSLDFEDLGYADIRFDTPEPRLRKLRRAYPEGRYRFVAKTAAGNKLVNRVELSYDLLEAPEILFPLEGDEDIPAVGLEARWAQIPDAVAVQLALETEDEEGEDAMIVDLPGDAVSFTFPDDFVQFGLEYTMDVIGIAENGNQTVSDVQFTTLAAP